MTLNDCFCSIVVLNIKHTINNKQINRKQSQFILIVLKVEVDFELEKLFLSVLSLINMSLLHFIVEIILDFYTLRFVPKDASVY